ncbi:hypothetical protein [Hyalangium sp.]|uniref:hypothetical protein n=1 Tax=Hyalangium sp. TaxID=2028555 RepID=UPI002D58B71E|nr:hypothetical protein [Hyalangium sp.]HYH95838.1 hypothetical protein [Hyalangium sp.]
MATDVRSSGNNNAAAEAARRAAEAAEAARRAAEAARRAAEQARQQAEQARQAQQNASKNAEGAAKQVGEARKELVHGQQQLESAKPEQREAAKKNVERLKGDVDSAREKLKTANRELLDADTKLQKAEEAVARSSKSAEEAMLKANTTAKKDPLNALNPFKSDEPFSKDEIAKAGPKANEIRDSFDGADGAARDELSKKLGVDASTDSKEIQANLDANRDFAQLKQDPAKAKTLSELNIRDGKDLRGFGKKLATQAEGGAEKDALNLKGVKDKEALASIVQTSGNTLTGKAKETLQDELFAKQVASGQDPNKAANLKGTDLAVAAYNSELKDVVTKPVEDWTEADANKFTDALADQVEKHKGDPEAVESLMTLSGSQLKRSAELVGKATEEKGSEDDIKGLTNNLSRIGTAAPPRAAAQLAIGIAKEIPEDSEQNWVDDGFGKFISEGGSAQFRDTIAAALKEEGREEAAEELIEKGGGSGLDDIAGDVWDGVKDAAGFLADKAGDAARGAYNFVSDQVIGRLGDSIRNAAANALNIDDQINKLESPGDSFTVKAGVEGTLFGADLGAGVEMKVTKTEDGYSMELQGEGTAGVASKLELPGLTDAELSATGTASATVKFDFKNAADVEKAAETVAGVAIGAAATAGPLAPVGAAMLASAGSELGFIGEHYESTTLKLEGKGEVSAEAGNSLGLPGAKIAGSVSNATAIEIPKDGPPNLILEQKVGVEGNLDVAGGVGLPSGGTLSPGKVDGKAEISLETKVPINLSPGELISDPVGALKQAGRTAVDQSTTKLSANVEFSAGAEIQGGPVTLGGDQGLQISLSAEAKTKDIVGSLGKALSGDLSGALSSLNENTKVEGEVRAFTDDTLGFEDKGVSVGIASIDVTAEAETRSSEILTDFEGTPSELLEEFSGVINGVAFNRAA